MDITRYTQALIDYAQLFGGIGDLQQLGRQLFQKIKTGEGKTLVTTSPVGKSFQFQVTMTVEEQFSAVVQAIKVYQGAQGDSPVTFIDFSRIDTRTPNSLPLDPLLY